MLFHIRYKMAAVLAAMVFLLSAADVKAAEEFHFFAPHVMQRLKLSDNQQKQLTQLEADLLASMEKIFTPEQFQKWKKKKEMQIRLSGQPLDLNPDQEQEMGRLQQEGSALMIKALEKILTPEQWAQCQQNTKGQRPPTAGLSLTPDQWKQVMNTRRSVNTSLRPKFEAILTPAQFQHLEAQRNLIEGLGASDEQRQKIQDLDASAMKSLEKILTTEQFQLLQ